MSFFLERASCLKAKLISCLFLLKSSNKNFDYLAFWVLAYYKKSNDLEIRILFLLEFQNQCFFYLRGNSIFFLRITITYKASKCVILILGIPNLRDFLTNYESITLSLVHFSKHQKRSKTKRRVPKNYTQF